MISLLDIIGQINLIQDSNSLSGRNRGQIVTTNSLSDTQARIFIKNGELILDTNNHEVTSFEIMFEDAKKADVEEFLSALGFSVFLKENNGQLSMVAFSLDSVLKGTVVLAKVKDAHTRILSVLLSDQEANEIPCEISDYMLGVVDVPAVVVPRVINYPNPFKEATTIAFFSSKNHASAILQIFDYTGKKLTHENIKSVNKGVNTYQFRPQYLSSGIYFYTISFGSEYLESSPVGKMIIK